MHHRKRIVTLATATLVAAVIGLTGCSGGASNTPAVTGNDYVIGYGDVNSLDSNQFKSETGYDVTANVYGTLLKQKMVEKDGYLVGVDEYDPSLAESVEYDAAGTTLVIKLKPDLKFADGTALTADDVVYTLQRGLSDAGYTSVFAAYLNIANPTTGIRAVDSTTVNIAVTAPSSVAKKFLAFQSFGILSKAAAEKNGKEKWATDYFAKNATPSGPYKISEWNPGQSITLKKNAEYRGATNNGADTVQLLNMPGADQRLLALQNKSIDIAVGMSPSLAAKAEKDPSLKVYRIPTSSMVYMGMNNNNSTLANKAIRQAISYLVPYSAIKDKVMQGSAGTAYGPVPFPMGTSLDTDGTKTAYATDRDKATKLLAAAGVTGLTLKLSVQASDANAIQSATFIQSALAAAGITVNIDQLTDAAYTTGLGDGTFQLFIGSWYSWGEDPIFQMNFLLKSGAFTNYAHYSNPAFDALLSQAMATQDPGKRGELSKQAQQMAIDDAPWAFLYTQDVIVVTQAGIQGITKPDDQYLRFANLKRN